jgi:aryl-alcohol dehydrogenase-like predicted oxidoreductase
MTFGEDNGWGASPATSEANMAEYLDRGGNVIDTANTYTNGHSENIVGDFLAARPGLRDRVLLGTKFFANLHPGDPNGGGAGCGFRRNGAPRPKVLERLFRWFWCGAVVWGRSVSDGLAFGSPPSGSWSSLSGLG